MNNILVITRSYWPSLRKHWLSWLVTAIALSFGVWLHILRPYYLRDIVDIFISETPDAAQAKFLFMKLVLAIAGVQISYRIFDFGIVIHECRALRDLDNRSFHHLLRQSMQFFEDNHSGSLLTRARRFRSSYESITDLFFFHFGQNIVMFCAIAVAFVFALPSLALPFSIWTAIYIVYCVGTTLWKYPYDVANADKDSKVGAALDDSLSNNLAVRTYGQEQAEEERFAAVVEASYQARLRSWLRSNVIGIGQWILVATGELAFIWHMIGGWERGLFTAGDFVFAQSFILWAIGHLTGFGRNLRHLFTSIADAKEMAEVYESTSDVVDAPNARNLLGEDGTVEFHAVRFGYQGSSAMSKHAIQDFTYTLGAQQSLGLVGRSGSGKSTLVKLLLRFYDVDSGYIRIDNQDVADVTQTSLRQQLAVVLQQPFLFHRSIRDNVAFSAPGSTDDEIMHALELAHAWEFVGALPYQLDTLVGERGIKLSGGQQQRIAIARAILADSKILILDEATSNLDSETEQLIQLAIANLLRDRTAIVIAHRLSTIMQLDDIVVLSEGRIVENGRHDELLELDGVYKNLWLHQSGGYIN